MLILTNVPPIHALTEDAKTPSEVSDVFAIDFKYLMKLEHAAFYVRKLIKFVVIVF